MNQCAKACGDQVDTADGFHAVQSDRNSVDGIGASAFDKRERPLTSGGTSPDCDYPSMVGR